MEPKTPGACAVPETFTPEQAERLLSNEGNRPMLPGVLDRYTKGDTACDNRN